MARPAELPVRTPQPAWMAPGLPGRGEFNRPSLRVNVLRKFGKHVPPEFRGVRLIRRVLCHALDGIATQGF
jgi:hypothetical protein